MPLDDADKKTISDLIAAALKPDVLAPVVAAHVKEATKGLPTAESLAAVIAAEVAKVAPKADDDANKGGKGKDGKADDPAAARLTALEKQLADERTARAAAEKASRVDANRAKVKDALTKAGVPADKLHLAMPVVEASGALVLDGDTPGWKGKDSYGVDAVLDFDAGAKAWTGSADGKHFLPAADVTGTGDRNGTRRTGGDGPAKLSDLRNSLGSLIANGIG